MSPELYHIKCDRMGSVFPESVDSTQDKRGEGISGPQLALQKRPQFANKLVKLVMM